jgi:regulator of replication initiation timing
MNLAPRIFRDATQATLDGAERRLQREAIDTERLRRNTRDRDTDALHEAEDENVRLQRENRALKQRLADQQTSAAAAIRTLANQSDSFRRTMMYLRATWAPQLPDDAPFKASLAPLVDQQREAATADAAWQREIDTYIDAVLQTGGPSGS